MGQLLVVDPQPELQALEELGHGVGAHVDAEETKLGGDFLGCAPGPFDAGHGVAGGVVGHQGLDVGDDLGSFF